MGSQPEPTDRRTTTVQITNEIWAALDRRKQKGESFDDVIRRLIEATGVGVAALAGPHPDVDMGDPEPLDDEKSIKETCVFHDPIDGTCGDPAEYRQWWCYEESEEKRWFYYCDEHVPDTP